METLDDIGIAGVVCVHIHATIDSRDLRAAKGSRVHAEAAEGLIKKGFENDDPGMLPASVKRVDTTARPGAIAYAALRNPRAQASVMTPSSPE